MYKGEKYFPVHVSCGLKHSAIVAYRENPDADESDHNTLASDWSKSYVFCMGSNKNGRLGLGCADESDSDSEDEKHEPKSYLNFNGKFMPSLDKEKILDNKLIRQVACGGNYTLALTEEGDIYAWGEGVTGALGTGHYQDQHYPTKIVLEITKHDYGNNSGAEKASYIAAGYCHSLAISYTGVMYAWGNNDFGQLGIVGKGMEKGPSTNKPEKITAVKNRMEKVACGMFHSAAISQEEYLFTWGANKNGQLGHLDFSNRDYPERVLASELKDESIRWVACGPNHTLTVTRSGEMFGFGNNASNRLGCKDYKLKMNKNLPPTKILLSTEQEKLRIKSAEALMQVATSSNCSMALNSAGKLFTWGKNFKDCLGREVRNEEDNKKAQERRALMHIEGDLNYLENVEQEDEDAYFAFRPYEVSMPFKKFKAQKNAKTLSTRFINVQCGLYHTVGLTDAGEVWVWGSNSSGQHGVTNEAIIQQFENSKKVKESDYSGELPWTAYPTLVSRFDIKANRRITLVCTGSEHILAVENGKKTYGWGRNSEGQLGIGRTSPYVIEPEPIKEFAGVPIHWIAAGESHSLVVDTLGVVYAFGSNTNGRLGLGSSTTIQLSPKKVYFEENPDVVIVKVACGTYHSLALDNQGKVYSWGGGWYGQLGHNNLENQFVPQEIDTKNTFVDIAAGKVNSAAINKDHQIFIWGLKEAFLKFYDALDIDEDQNSKHQKGEDKTQKQENLKRKLLKEKYITSPTLWDYFAQEKVLSVCLGDTFNALINNTKTLYVWGNFETKLNAELDEKAMQLYKKKYENLNDTEKYDVRKRLKPEIESVPGLGSCVKVSVGSNHVFVLSDSDDLYTWGLDNYTGRLGLAFDEFFEKTKVGRKPEKKNYKSEYLTTQEKVKWFVHRFLQNKKELERQGKEEESNLKNDGQSRKESSRRGSSKMRGGSRSSKGGLSGSSKKFGTVAEEDDDDDDDNVAVEANLIEDLRREENTKRNARLQQMDAKLRLGSAKLLKKFEKVRDFESSLEAFLSKVESETFKRIAGPPFSKNTKKKQTIDLPQAYVLNKSLYKKLLTVFQMHPCYLRKLYNPPGENVDAVFDIIKDVYGDLEMDRRKINMFMSLALTILEIELEKVGDAKTAKLTFGSSEDGEEERTIPLFLKMFNHLVMSQRKNVLYLKTITDKIGGLVADNFQGEKVEKNKFSFFLHLNANKAGYKEFVEKLKNESEETKKKIIKDNVTAVKNKIISEIFKLMISPTDNISISTKYLFYRTVEILSNKFSDMNAKVLKSKALGNFLRLSSHANSPPIN